MAKTISVISSKGGVGKTAIAVSLIDVLGQKGFKVTGVDADVNAPNLNTWFDKIHEWDTIKDIEIFPLPNKYKGCKKIELFCDGKEVAIENEKRGSVYLKKDYIPSFDSYSINLVSGDIMGRKTGSGKVVEGTIKASEEFDYDFRVIDSAPGTGYPVLTCINNSDYVILVTESTSLGLRDLKKLVEIVRNKKVKYGVVVNGGDNDEIIREIRNYSGKNYIGFLPYDKTIPLTLKKSIPPIRECSSSNEIKSLLEKIFDMISFNKVKN